MFSLPKNIVSTKIALYSHDLSKVLVMRYPRRGLTGLPGGHVEPGEDPDKALKRELIEELTLKIDDITRADFFLREGDKGPIILAYTAVLPEDAFMMPTHPQYEFAEWVAPNEVAGIPKMSPEYKRFVLEQWPQA